MGTANKTTRRTPKVFRPSIGWVLPVLALLVAVAMVISTGSGFIKIPWTGVVRIMAARLTGAHGLVAQVDDLALTVVTDVLLLEDTGKAQRTDRLGPGEFSIFGRLAVQTLP